MIFSYSYSSKDVWGLLSTDVSTLQQSRHGLRELCLLHENIVIMENHVNTRKNIEKHMKIYEACEPGDGSDDNGCNDNIDFLVLCRKAFA